MGPQFPPTQVRTGHYAFCLTAFPFKEGPPLWPGVRFICVAKVSQCEPVMAVEPLGLLSVPGWTHAWEHCLWKLRLEDDWDGSAFQLVGEVGGLLPLCDWHALCFRTAHVGILDWGPVEVRWLPPCSSVRLVERQVAEYLEVLVLLSEHPSGEVGPV